MTSVNVGRSVVTTGAQGTPGVRAYQSLQPLYSSVGVNNAALPSEITFFGYKQGDNVPGAGNFSGVRSTPFHTNMRLGGQLPRPQLFICEGVRFYVPMIAATTTANTPELVDAGFSTTDESVSQLLDSLVLLTYSSWFTLTLGDRQYVDHPLWMLPSNVGFGGIASLAYDDAAAADEGHLDLTLVNTQGALFKMFPFDTIDGVRGPILLAEGQQLKATLRCQWTTNPSMLDDLLLVAILDGQMTRAAQ